MRPPLPAALALLALVAACTTVPTQRTAEIAPLADEPFAAQGRISARHANDAVTASFRWQHDPPRDELDLSTPVGQMVAQLSGDASVPYVRVQLADGQSLEAADWDALTRRALGFPLPVAGLAAWIRGGPHAGSTFQTETNVEGRVALLRQDGWEIVFEYGDGATPSRLVMTYPGVEVRVAVQAVE